jgi:hypothetical protein
MHPTRMKIRGLEEVQDDRDQKNNKEDGKATD